MAESGNVQLPGQIVESEGQFSSQADSAAVGERRRRSFARKERPSDSGLQANRSSYKSEDLEDTTRPANTWYKRTKRRYNTTARRQSRIFKDEAQSHPFPWARWIVKTQTFEFIVSLLIVANCVFIGFQAQSRNPVGTQKFMLSILEHFFTASFLIDLVLRVLAHGWTFLTDRSNFVDIFLVLLSVLVSWVMVPLGLEIKILRKLTVLRTLRLVRLARAVRTRPEFKEMWSLLKGLVDSRETLIWTYVMIALLLYFFAIISTSLIGKQERFMDDEVAQTLFGDVPKSMLTLFQVMTLDSWSTLCRPLMKNGQSWVAFFFVGFISVAQFVLMNLITAVIVENAFSDAKSEDKELAQKAAREKEDEAQDLKVFFKALDEDGSGTVSKDEIHNARKKRKVRQKLCALDIMPKDIEELWEILDDGDGQLTVEEFVNGLQRLRGEAKAKDILRLKRELRILESSVEKIENSLSTSQDQMLNVKTQLRTASMDIAGMHRTVLKARESIKHAAATQSLRTPR